MAERNLQNCAPEYTSVADDSRESPKKREAAIMVSAAEGHNNNDEDFLEARKLANNAVKIFKELGDGSGKADAIRIAVNSYRVELQHHVDDKDKKGGHATDKKDKVSEILAEAERIAEEALAEFKNSSDKRGQALMLLSLADVKSEQPIRSSKEEAKEHCKDAIAIFKEDGGDPKMEAHALATLVNVYLKLYELQNAYEAALVSVEACKKLQDKKLLADALHGMAVSMMLLGMDALPTFKQALAIYKELGESKVLAFENDTIAGMLLKRGKHRAALPYAKAAMKLFEEIGYGKGWQPHARGLTVKAYMGKGDSEKALKVANEGLEKAQEAGDFKNKVLAYQTIFEINMELPDGGGAEDALQAATSSLETCREAGNRRWMANCQHNRAQAFLAMKLADESLKASDEAISIFKELEEERDLHTVLYTTAHAHMEKENFGKAIQVMQECIDLPCTYSEEARATLEMARIQLRRAVVSKKKQFRQEALFHAESARDVFVRTMEFDKQGEAWDFISTVQADLGNATEAIEAAQKAAQAFADGGFQASQVDSLRDAVRLMLDTNRAGGAARLASEALSAAKATGDPYKEIDALLTVSQAEVAKASAAIDRDTNPDNAFSHISDAEEKACRPAREAVSLSKKLRSDRHLAASLETMGQALCFSGNNKAGLAAAEEAVDLFAAAGEERGQASSLLVVAEAYFGLEQSQDANSAAEEALSMFKRIGDTEGVARAQEVIAEFKQVAAGAVASRTETTAAIAGAGQASLAAAPAKQGLDPKMVQSMVLKHAGDNAGEDPDGIDLDSPLMDIGLDSLSAVSFRESLSREIGFNLPASLVFDYPSVQAVVDFCVEESAV